LQSGVAGFHWRQMRAKADNKGRQSVVKRNKGQIVDDWLEEFWSDILSEQPLRIRAAWLMLEAEEQIAVRNHLMRMATEEGWAEVQRLSARAALQAISDNDEPDELSSEKD
jgi:hypothetical protein